MGANGAGKSTLLLHFNGCLLPASGQVRIGEMPVTKKTLTHVRRTVGLVFQDPDDQLFMPLVFDDVAFGPLNLGLSPEEVERAGDAGPGRGGRRPSEGPAAVPSVRRGKASRGHRRGVVACPRPSWSWMSRASNLDPKTRRQLIELLKTFDHTLIIATHDLDLVLDLCPRTLVLREGCIAADGPTAAIMQDADLLASCNLEKPLRLQGCPVCTPA